MQECNLVYKTITFLNNILIPNNTNEMMRAFKKLERGLNSI